MTKQELENIRRITKKLNFDRMIKGAENNSKKNELKNKSK